jgi:hypothetical protein
MEAGAVLNKVNAVALSLIVRDFFQPSGPSVVPGEKLPQRRD